MGLPFLVSDKVQERIQISSVQKKFLAFQNLEFMVKFEWSGKREQVEVIEDIALERRRRSVLHIVGRALIMA